MSTKTQHQHLSDAAALQAEAARLRAEAGYPTRRVMALAASAQRQLAKAARKVTLRDRLLADESLFA